MVCGRRGAGWCSPTDRQGSRVSGFGLRLSLANGIVADGVGGNCLLDTPLVSLGHNLESDDSCGLTAAGDLVNSAPLLGPLQDNGGGTKTHALLSGSPALDAADAVNCLATDQRGVPRPQGPACDIGAYEAGAVPGFLYLSLVRR